MRRAPGFPHRSLPVTAFLGLLDLDGTLWAVSACCAFFVGISKSGVPGAGVLAVPVLAAFMPARESTGFLLPPAHRRRSFRHPLLATSRGLGASSAGFCPGRWPGWWGGYFALGAMTSGDAHARHRRHRAGHDPAQTGGSSGGRVSPTSSPGPSDSPRPRACSPDARA